MSNKKKLNVLILAPGKKTEGGITSVIKEYQSCNFWKKYNCIWIETYINKNHFNKLYYFLRAFIQFLFYLPSSNLVNIHLSWHISALRKLPFFVIAKIFDKPLIINLHSGAEPIINSKFNRTYKYIFKNATACVVLAKCILKELENYFYMNNAKVIYNPCLNNRNHINFNYERDNTILFAGHITEKKGIYDLIKAFSLVSKDFPNWKLLIAGSGNENKMNSLIRKCNITDRVKYLGWIRGKEKARVFNSVSIFCLPSYTEGFPMAVLDAWAYDLPVITTPVGGLRDVLIHKENALLFEPGDVEALSENLRSMISDKKLYNKICKSSELLCADTFNIDTIATQIDNLYYDLTNSK